VDIHCWVYHEISFPKTKKTSLMDFAKRYKNNPILKPGDIIPSNAGMKIECLLNPGVFKFDEKIWMLLRVAERPIQETGKLSFPIIEEGKTKILHFDESDPLLDASDARIIKYDGVHYLTTLSHLRLVCSDDAVNFYEPEGYIPIFGEGPQESFGIEDCRVATMDDGFHLTYTKVSAQAVGVGYIFTKDWKNFERRGMIFPPHNKDCAIFEEKINDKYYALHRPSSPELGGNYIWIAESPDLRHWGNHKCIVLTRENSWDSARVGGGAAPIKTSKGWLEIYHGATKEHRYCLGALLLDLNDPSKVIARSEDPIMEPVAEYEQTGFFGNVVFTNGQLVDGDKLTIYYGASDEVICVAEFSISEILNSLNV
jgi:beta-1,2-mannobiose phosphorylase / 1,2-beta-oligomannan phosphorylase